MDDQSGQLDPQFIVAMNTPGSLLKIGEVLPLRQVAQYFELNAAKLADTVQFPASRFEHAGHTFEVVRP